MVKALGIILIIDALLSMVLVSDKRFWWQVGRGVRLAIGLMLVGGIK